MHCGEALAIVVAIATGCVLGYWLGLVGGYGAAPDNRGALANGVINGGVFIGDPADPATHKDKECDEQQDCEDEDCHAVGGEDPPTQCEHLDDYWFAERNDCVDGSNYKCVLSDWSKCEDRVTCNRNPLFPCDYSASCDDWHNYCNTVTIWEYDDCSTVAPQGG